MTYEEALEEIHGFLRFGSKLGLSRMNRLMELLGNLQDEMKVIHVAGTNGKGSVCRYLYSMLQEQGYKVGLYTSPFIEVFNERIEFNGEMISNEDLAECTDAVMQMVRKMVAAGEESPTEFEVVTAVAFLYFSRKDMDYLILEVGLGGRGDSTNVIKAPLASVITSISFDHMEYLGDTLPQIAMEKAGIIKEGCPVIYSIKDRESAEKVCSFALEKGCLVYDVRGTLREVDLEVRYGIDPLISVAGGLGAARHRDADEKERSAGQPDQPWREGLWHSGESCAEVIGNICADISGYRFDARIMGEAYSGVKLSMAGPHQVENACCALTVIEALKKGNKIKIEKSSIYEGLLKAKQIGRFEILQDKPYIVIDGAHNDDGAAMLAKTVRAQFEGQRILLICGILADKEIDKMIAEFGSFGADLAATEPDSPRKLSSAELCARIQNAGYSCEDAGDWRGAIRYGKERLENYDLIIYAGSLYLIGKIREGFQSGHQ